MELVHIPYVPVTVENRRFLLPHVCVMPPFWANFLWPFICGKWCHKLQPGFDLLRCRWTQINHFRT